MFIKKNLKGFTIIELLIVTVIFVLILSVTVISFRRGERRDRLRLAAETLASNLRKMQTQALTGIASGEIVVPGGFGVYLTASGAKDRYILFRDDGSNAYESSTDTVLDTIILPEGIFINSLTTDPLTVVFRPPKPAVYLNGAQILAEAIIVLSGDNIDDKQGAVTLGRITGRVQAALQDR